MRIVQRILLFPFALLWDAVTSIRNYLFDKGIAGSQEFDLPVLGVGNLTVGGSGKSPHVEYMANFLNPTFHIGVLSRGYLRKSSGYRFVTNQSTVKQVGDEALALKQKHPEFAVAVSESRLLGIPRLLMDDKNVRVVILDDIFQHRAVKPGLMLLLTDFNNLFVDDMILPAGMLRESQRGAKRADYILVTKCPTQLTDLQRKEIIRKINPADNQRVFFTSFQYGTPYSLFHQQNILKDYPKKVLLVTGIAKPGYLKAYFEQQAQEVHLLPYPDHYNYEERTFYDIQQTLKNLGGDAAVIITEKDAVKWKGFIKLLLELDLPVYVQPVQVKFLFNEDEAFNARILTFVQQFYN